MVEALIFIGEMLSAQRQTGVRRNEGNVQIIDRLNAPSATEVT